MKFVVFAAVVAAICISETILHTAIGFEKPKGWRGWVYDLPAVAFGYYIGLSH